MQRFEKLGMLLALALSGCAVTTSNNVEVVDSVVTKTNALVAQQPAGRFQKYSRFADVPYVGTRVADAPPSRNIPAVLTGKVPVSRLAFDRKLTIKEFADRITEIARVPVVVSDDITKEKGQPDTVVVNFSSDNETITLDRVMDMVLWPANLNWTWQENRVVISRLLSRTWEIKAQMDVTLDDGSGVPTGVSGGAVGTQTSTKSTTKDTSTGDTWVKITGDIKRLLGTAQNDFEVNKYTGTVTVRGSREQIDMVDAYVKEINKRMSRVVAVRFDTYRVNVGETKGAGVDFQAVINGAVTVATTGASSVVQSGAAVLATKLLTPAGTTTPNTSNMGNRENGLHGLQGSSLVLQALSTVGTTVHALERVVRTRNMMRTSIDVDTSQTFVCQTTPATVSNGVTTPGSAQQCLLSSGFKLGLAPAVANDGTIALSYKLELSDAGSPVTFSTGGTSVQNVTWTTLTEHSNVVVREGEPLVVATLKTANADNNKSAGLLSTSAAASESNQRTVVVMTAYMER